MSRTLGQNKVSNNRNFRTFNRQVANILVALFGKIGWLHEEVLGHLTLTETETEENGLFVLCWGDTNTIGYCSTVLLSLNAPLLCLPQPRRCVTSLWTDLLPLPAAAASAPPFAAHSSPARTKFIIFRTFLFSSRPISSLTPCSLICVKVMKVISE